MCVIEHVLGGHVEVHVLVLVNVHLLQLLQLASKVSSVAHQIHILYLTEFIWWWSQGSKLQFENFHQCPGDKNVRRWASRFHHPQHLEILYMDPLMYIFSVSIELSCGISLFKFRKKWSNNEPSYDTWVLVNYYSWLALDQTSHPCSSSSQFSKRRLWSSPSCPRKFLFFFLFGTDEAWWGGSKHGWN